MNPLSPKARKLREAASDYCGKQGVNAATIATVAEKIVGLLSARWEHICDVALAEENEGKVNVGLRLTFDMTRKAPVGMITLSFARRTRDEADFTVEDPEQATLEFEEATPQRRTRPPRRRAAAATEQTPEETP